MAFAVTWSFDVRWKAKALPAENARMNLPKMAQRWFDLGAGMLEPEATAGTLHAFRIETKRFRYTLEAFQPVYGPGLRRILGALKDLQRALGEMNDCAVATALIKRALPDGDGPSVRKLETCCRRRRAAFRKLWSATFSTTPEETRRWVSYLSRPRRGGLPGEPDSTTQ